MKAVSVKATRFKEDGSREVDVVIVADTTPSPLPTTGADVDGLDSTDTFAPFSLLYVVGSASSKIYIANESGVFVAQ